MKKFALLLIFALLMSVTACVATDVPAEPTTPPDLEQTPSPAPVPTPDDPEVKNYRIGLCSRENNSWGALCIYEIMRYFETRETDTTKYYIIREDAWFDYDRQIEQVENLIERRVDALIIIPVDSSSTTAMTKMADDAGIPVVYITDAQFKEDINNSSSNICYVRMDHRQIGTVQGEIIANLPDRGDINGDGVVSYVMIMGDPENVETQYRTEHSIKALTGAGIIVEELIKETGNWEMIRGHDIAANALKEYGENIDVIFCNNDGMALGALQAIQEAGRIVGEDIYLVGIDGIPETVDAINDGLMTGTVLYDHIGPARAAVSAIINFLEGTGNDEYIFVDIFIAITQGYNN